MKNNKFLMWSLFIIILNTVFYFISLNNILKSAILTFLTILILYFSSSFRNKKKETPKQNESNNSQIIDSIFSLWETMGFDIEQLRWLSNDSIKFSKKVVVMANNVEKLSGDNSKNVQRINGGIAELASVSENLNNIIKDIESNSARSIDILNANRKELKDISALLSELNQGIQLSSSSNSKFIQSSNEIYKFVDYIKQISKQTNLLALNASIESARAGNKGFSVLAIEIRKLSEETSKVVVEIEQIVGKIVGEVKISDKSMKECVEKIIRVDRASYKADELLQSIENILSNINKELKSIKDISNVQLETSTEMEQAVEAVAASVKNAHAITNETKHTIEIQENKNVELLSFCNKLGDMTKDVQRFTAKLKKENEIIIGINPFTSPENIKRMYVPIIQKVFNKIGCIPRVVIVKDYDALSEGISQGTIDIGWFSPFAYVNARQKYGVIPLVTPKVDGKASYNGYIITRNDSPIRQLKDLKNKNFGYVDTESASGYLFARYLFKEQGINPDSFFKESFYLTSHDNVIKVVLSGEADGGATYNEAIDNARKNGIDISRLNILSKTSDIPKDAIAASPKVSQELCEKIKKGFVEFNEFDKKVCPIDGFIESSDEKYEVIRKVMKALKQ